MGGGLMQLVAYGAQDVYLTGNPQITFFKVVYRRHTNFSIESIRQVWQGDAVQPGKTAEAIISRNGDLVCGMHIELSATGTDTLTSDGSLAWRYIKDIEVQIGGQKIDKHTGNFMSKYQQLTDPHFSGYSDPEASVKAATTGNSGTSVGDTASLGNPIYQFYLPLQFWFCRNPGLALPLIALQYHEVKIILNVSDVNITTYFKISNSNLYVDYIYLDTDERKRFAQVSHEYLIEQVQYRAFGDNGQLKWDIGFINHPVKEILWMRSDKTDDDILIDPSPKWKLRLNGHDRFSERYTSYFTCKQVSDYHSGSMNITGSVGNYAQGGVAVYSFALKPEEHQPSGTCNFSRIDSAELLSSKPLTSDYGDHALEIYAINYNVLRVMSGMGGLAYSN
tara:strand:+ start:12018 stop:13193 length:1176 start_codon:yes stop_codon:yes gene_type:complete